MANLIFRPTGLYVIIHLYFLRFYVLSKFKNEKRFCRVSYVFSNSARNSAKGPQNLQRIAKSPKLFYETEKRTWSDKEIQALQENCWVRRSLNTTLYTKLLNRVCQSFLDLLDLHTYSSWPAPKEGPEPVQPLDPPLTTMLSVRIQTWSLYWDSSGESTYNDGARTRVQQSSCTGYSGHFCFRRFCYTVSVCGLTWYQRSSDSDVIYVLLNCRPSSVKPTTRCTVVRLSSRPWSPSGFRVWAAAPHSGRHR